MRKLLLDPEAARLKERERWRRRCLNNKGKPVTELSQRQQRLVRRKWKLQKAEYRQAQRQVQQSSPVTPPPEGEQSNSRHTAGRRRVKRDRAAAYKTIEKLRSALDDERHRRERYRKQLARLQRKLSPSQMGDTPTQSNSPAIVATPSPAGSTLSITPRSKTRGMLCGSTRVDSNVGVALLLHNIMIESMKNKRRGETSKGQLKCALIEKYRLKNFTKNLDYQH